MIELPSYEDTVRSGLVELPPIEDMIRWPFVRNVDLEELRRRAPEDLKQLIDKVPLQGGKKWVGVNLFVQKLTPNVLPAPRGNWHLDADGDFMDEEPNIVHLLLSDCTSRTEFLKERLIVEELEMNMKASQVEVWLCRNKHDLMVPVKCESRKFITFLGGRHMHRAIRPDGSEYRMLFRVNESNFRKTYTWSEGYDKKSRVFDDGMTDYTKIDEEFISMNNERRHTKAFDNIVKGEDGVTINEV